MDIVHHMNREPCALYDLLIPLYFTDLIVTSQDQINIKRREVIEYMQHHVLSNPITSIPSSFLALRPPQFQYAYHNKNDVSLFTQMSSFYRKVTGWRDEKGRQSSCPRDRINVAFVSNMFSRLSSVMRDRQGIIKHLSRDEFYVTLIVFDPPQDEFAKALYKSVDRIILLNRTVSDQLAGMRRFNFDVIVYGDLNMCGETLAMSHHRLAPVQINTWGHSDTSGISTIDYYISSKLYELGNDSRDAPCDVAPCDATPCDAQAQYSETLILHDGLCTYYDRPLDPQSVNFLPRSYFGLPDQAIIYLCYQSLFKISPEFQGVIRKIVHASIHNVVVFIKGFLGCQEQINFYKMFEASVGYPHINQIYILERQDFVKINNIVHVSDVALDTFPFGGCNTTLECFNLGKPVVTMPSSFLRGRFTLGFYKAMGIDEFIVSSEDEYVDKAQRLGSDRAYREKWSTIIKNKSSVLWNDRKSITEWENTLVELSKPYVHRVNMLDNVSMLLPCPVKITGKLQMTAYANNKNHIVRLLLQHGFTLEKSEDQVYFTDGIWSVFIDPLP